MHKLLDIHIGNYPCSQVYLICTRALYIFWRSFNTYTLDVANFCGVLNIHVRGWPYSEVRLSTHYALSIFWAVLYIYIIYIYIYIYMKHRTFLKYIVYTQWKLDISGVSVIPTLDLVYTPRLYAHCAVRFLMSSNTHRSTRWHCWLRHCATSQKAAGHWNLSLTFLQPHYGPNRNDYQGYIVGVKAADA